MHAGVDIVELDVLSEGDDFFLFFVIARDVSADPRDREENEVIAEEETQGK